MAIKHTVPEMRRIRGIHFVGIGGAGMCGIAEVLANQGYAISGSDIKESPVVDHLRSLGARVEIGHRAENIGDADVVVTSSAVNTENLEVAEAHARRVPVVPRAEMLAELMRFRHGIAVAGTHGKTTTTSLVSALFDAAGFDPTVINGGIINAYGTNARLGTGEWMVVEADESDGTMVKLPAVIAVVTNIDPEHMEHYGSFDRLREAFLTFVENIPFYGFAVLCIDHPEVQSLISRISDRRLIPYGFSPQADIRGTNLRLDAEGAAFDVAVRDRQTGNSRTIADLRLPMMGRHNVQNALAVVAIAVEMGLPEDVLRAALAGFGGVKRRFTRTGTAHGITVIDDYGHHPVEISAVLSAARQACAGRILAVVQPHRYSRLRDLFEDFCTCFNDADAVIVADVYAAGEAPIEGIDRQALVEGLRAHGHRRVHDLPDPAMLAQLVREEAQPGDYVVCLGAGSITRWANDLPDQLAGLPAPVPRPSARSAGGAA